MVEVDINKKYSHFMAPKAQISLEQKDISLSYRINPASIIVEDAVSVQFNFDNASAWIDSALFKVGMALKIKMGYANMLEVVFEGQINAVKTIFPGNGPPQIIVFGKEKNAKQACTDTVVSLSYGSTLNCFTSTQSEDISNVTLCIAECIGLPDIKAGITVAITGLGSQFSQRYLVDKAIHTFDDIQGFRTQFVAKSVAIARCIDLNNRNLPIKITKD